MDGGAAEHASGAWLKHCFSAWRPKSAVSVDLRSESEAFRLIEAVKGSR